jgi:hypothetical protein
MGVSRAEAAEDIALAAIVFTRRARREGCVNVITNTTVEDIATQRGYGGDQYSVRTARRIIIRECTRQGETGLLGFGK